VQTLMIIDCPANYSTEDLNFCGIKYSEPNIGHGSRLDTHDSEHQPKPPTADSTDSLKFLPRQAHLTHLHSLAHAL